MSKRPYWPVVVLVLIVLCAVAFEIAAPMLKHVEDHQLAYWRWWRKRPFRESPGLVTYDGEATSIEALPPTDMAAMRKSNPNTLLHGEGW